MSQDAPYGYQEGAKCLNQKFEINFYTNLGIMIICGHLKFISAVWHDKVLIFKILKTAFIQVYLTRFMWTFLE